MRPPVGTGVTLLALSASAWWGMAHCLQGALERIGRCSLVAEQVRLALASCRP